MISPMGGRTSVRTGTADALVWSNCFEDTHARYRKGVNVMEAKEVRTAPREANNGSRRGWIGWAAGAAVVGFMLVSIFIMLLAVLGMVVVIGLGYDQTFGAPAYAGMFILAIIGYALVVRFGVRQIQLRRDVPWVIWPGLAAFPVIWAVFSTLTMWRGMMSPAVSVLGGLGLLLAWLLVRVDKAAQPPVPAQACVSSEGDSLSSNDPGR